MVSKNIILFCVLILLGTFLTGCDIGDLTSEDMQKISENLIQCDAPYIRHGAECCLDVNENKICDDDDAKITNTNENSITGGVDTDSNIKTDTDDSNNVNKNVDTTDVDEFDEVEPETAEGKNIEALSSELFSDVPIDRIRATPSEELIAQNTNVDIDSDFDGIPDTLELSGKLGYVTDPNKKDTDNDGLSDLREYWWVCDPTNSDTNGDFITDGDSVNNKEAYPYRVEVSESSALGTYDLDGDGIPTAAEKYDIGLNYKVYSSDGDRYGDGQEFFGIDSTTWADPFSLPSYVIADPFNPATPDIAITVEPDYQLIFDQTVIEGSDESENRIESSTTTNSFDQSVSLTAGIQATKTIGVSTTHFPEVGGKVEFYAGIESSTSYTFHGENSFIDESTRSKYTSDETDFSKTQLRVSLRAKNIGKDIMTSELKEITLNYYIGNDALPFFSNTLDVSLTNLKPGDALTLTETDATLGYDELLRVLSGEGVTIELAHYSFGEDQIYLENAKASSIKVVVDDYGFYDEEFLVPSSSGMTIKEVLDKFGYSYEFDGGRLVMFHDKREKIAEERQHWGIFISRYFNEPFEFADDIEDSILYAGDSLIMKFRTDSDGDGLSDEDEFKLGTDEFGLDTDGDGIWDGYISLDGKEGELALGTNPRLRDTDFDFVPDDLELKEGTDPTDENSYPNIAFLYDYTDFRGERIEVIDKMDLYADFNNKVSSLIVPKGLAVILYDYDDYETKKYYDNAVIFGSVSDLSYYDNKATSVEVMRIEDLPTMKMIGKEGTTHHFADYFDSCDNCHDDVCFLLDIDEDKEKEASAYFCENTKHSDGYTYMYRVSEYEEKSYSFGRWEFELSKESGLYRLKNRLSSLHRDDYDICLYTDVTKDKAEEVRGFECNSGEEELYLNWNIQPLSDGWVKLVNQGSSRDRKTDVCLWMDADVDWVEELQGYNCNSVDDTDKIKWRFVVDLAK